MNKEELIKLAEERKEKIAKMSEEELKNASGGMTVVSPYQQGCNQFTQNVIVFKGEAPKQCAYCMFSTPYIHSKYMCVIK